MADDIVRRRASTSGRSVASRWPIPSWDLAILALPCNLGRGLVVVRGVEAVRLRAVGPVASTATLLDRRREASGAIAGAGGRRLVRLRRPDQVGRRHRDVATIFADHAADIRIFRRRIEGVVDATFVHKNSLSHMVSPTFL